MDSLVITIFGSSRPSEGHPEYLTARQLGNELARSGFTVCTGGYGGTMEGVSRGAAEAGGHVIGVTARSFQSRANRWVTEEIVVESWRDRLFRLIELGSGYVALPGGTGTLAEIAVVWEMLNKRILAPSSASAIRASAFALQAPRPLVLLGDFWKPVISLVEGVERQGSLWKESESPLIHFAHDPTEACRLLLQAFASVRPAG